PPPCPRAQSIRWAVGGCSAAGCCSRRGCNRAGRVRAATATHPHARRPTRVATYRRLIRIGDHSLILLGRARAAVNRACDLGDESLVEVTAAHDVHDGVRRRTAGNKVSLRSG
ncbi:hypothetical protein PMAYCL1PPCAC_00579, partial [Pristionchus mayeri]